MLSRLFELNPHAEAYEIRAVANLNIGKLDAAESDAARALRLSPMMHTAIVARALVHEGRSEREEAIALYRKCLSLFIDDSDRRDAHTTARERLRALGASLDDRPHVVPMPPEEKKVEPDEHGKATTPQFAVEEQSDRFYTTSKGVAVREGPSPHYPVLGNIDDIKWMLTNGRVRFAGDLTVKWYRVDWDEKSKKHGYIVSSDLSVMTKEIRENILNNAKQFYEEAKRRNNGALSRHFGLYDLLKKCELNADYDLRALALTNTLWLIWFDGYKQHFFQPILWMHWPHISIDTVRGGELRYRRTFSSIAFYGDADNSTQPSSDWVGFKDDLVAFSPQFKGNNVQYKWAKKCNSDQFFRDIGRGAEEYNASIKDSKR